MDAYILVLDTKGINVWCAAGKGTFGTDELVHRIKSVSLHNFVRHKDLILPQLGAPGVSAHEVKKQSGFRVRYGPVRATDLPAYIDTKGITPEKRRVQFNLLDRLVLTPMELVHLLLPASIIGIILLLLAGPLPAIATAAAVLAGTVLFPALLPWIPTPNFSTKGFILGAVTALPFAVLHYIGSADAASLYRTGWFLLYFLLMPSTVAFMALNFTGASTFTSRSGVKREIFAYVPLIALMIVSGLVLLAILSITKLTGV
jgi:hypothetical protein